MSRAPALPAPTLGPCQCSHSAGGCCAAGSGPELRARRAESRTIRGRAASGPGPRAAVIAGKTAPAPPRPARSGAARSGVGRSGPHHAGRRGGYRACAAPWAVRRRPRQEAPRLECGRFLFF